MKALIIFAMSLLTTAAMAGTQEITCTFGSNGDYQMTIFADGDAGNPMNIKITAVSLYNTDWGQNVEGTKRAVTGQYLTNDIFFDVRLADGQYLLVPQSIFDKDHDGTVYLNTRDPYYNCN